MIGFILRRLLQGVLTVTGVICILTILFFYFLNKDGSAAYEMLGQNASEESRQQVVREYGFDKPIPEQVILYFNDLLPVSIHSQDSLALSRFDPEKYSGAKLMRIGDYGLYIKVPYLRRSYQSHRKVADVLAEALPHTILLAIAAMFIGSLVGICFGIIAALKQETWIDKSLIVISTVGMSAPSFFTAILISWLFGYVLHQYTGLEMWGSLYEIDDFTGQSRLNFSNLILPALTLGIRPLSVLTQMTRNKFIEVSRADYVRTAQAKGLQNRIVILRHILTNCMNPLITTISGWLGSLLAGAVFVEYIFAWKGIGKEIVDGLQRLDYPIVMGGVITIAFMFVIISLLVDLVYAWIDPRIRLR